MGEDIHQRLLAVTSAPIVALDPAGLVTYANPASEALLSAALIGRSWCSIVHDGSCAGPCRLIVASRVGAHESSVELVDAQGEVRRFEVEARRLESTLGELEGFALGLRDLTEQDFDKRVAAFESDILERVSLGAPLNEVLDRITRGFEALRPNAVASILLFEEPNSLRLGSGPSLPEIYRDPAVRFPIGQGIGSCGTAAFRRELVIVSDIERDELWDDWRQFALPYGLRACWSAPILLADGRVGATFAIYHHQPRVPRTSELELVERIARVVRIALESERKERELRLSEQRFRRTFADAATGLVITDLSGRFLESNAAYRRLVGYSEDELKNLDFRAITIEDDLPRHDEHLRTLVRGEVESVVFEKRYRHKSGRVVWARVSGSLIADLDGRRSGIIGVAEDITAWRESVDELARSEATLRAQQGMLQMASTVGRMGAWRVEVPSLEYVWSSEARVVIGAAPEADLTRQAVHLHFAKEDRPLLKVAFDECGDQGKAFDHEVRLDRNDLNDPNGGRQIWVRVIGQAVRGADGTVVAVQGAIQDIDEVSRLRRDASALATRLATTLETITDAFITLDSDWKVTFMNGESERLLGMKRTQLIGKSLEDAFPTLGVPAAAPIFESAMKGGETVRLEGFSPTLKCWLEITGYPVQGGLAIYLRDISQRREAEEHMREQAALLERAQDAIMVRTLDHRIRYWNQSAARLYGWSKNEVLGSSAETLLYDDPTAFRAATARVLTHGDWMGEIEQTTRHGRRVIVEGRWTLVRDDAGVPKSILAINTDITEKKRLEQQFLRAQRLESIGTLAGGIAHDLNNMLTPIVMTSSILLQDAQNAMIHEDLVGIQQCAERGAEMVRQLLIFARGSDGRRSRVGMRSIAADTQKMVRETFPKNITIQLTTGDELWDVEADATQMHQLLTNLCVNARDAMPEGGHLTIGLENTVLDEVYSGMNLEAHPGPHILLRVEDTGSGMTADVLDRIFEPFYTTKEVGKGTGLGLSTVHAIVRGHRGFIHVYSELGKGSRFKVYLPAAQAVTDRELARAEQYPLPRGQGELILVVDDEELIRNVARRMLERYGYRVVTAPNGAEAVAIYAQMPGQIALVLTDMSMPVMDGPSTIIALRSIDPKVRIIGSSGLNANGNVAKAMDAGVQVFVPKPYTAEAMLRTIRRVLSD